MPTMLLLVFRSASVSSNTRSAASDAEVADGVEDPVQRHAEVALAAQAATFQPFEQRRKLAAAPMDDSDRDIHLGMQHVLRVQLLHHAIGDEFVVVGSTQALSDCLEGQQKAGEVFVLIERAGFVLR